VPPKADPDAAVEEFVQRHSKKADNVGFNDNEAADDDYDSASSGSVAGPARPTAGDLKLPKVSALPSFCWRLDSCVS
jgi:hypothetical protein